MAVTILDSINEGQTGHITLSFKDNNNNAVTVTTAQYKINDLISGNNIAAGNLTINNNSYVFELTPLMNIIINNNANNEEHVLTIIATYGSNKTTGDYHFNVNNLEFYNASEG